MKNTLICNVCDKTFNIKEVVRGESSEIGPGKFICPSCSLIALEEDLLESETFIYAGFFRRSVAFLIDAIPLTIVVIIVFVASTPIGEMIREMMENRENFEYRMEHIIWKAIGRITSAVVYILYSTFLEASRYKGTVGKILLGMEVVDVNGNRLTRWQSFERNSMKIMSALPIMMGFVACLFSKRRRCWHDSLAGTYVINKRKNEKEVAQNPDLKY